MIFGGIYRKINERRDWHAEVSGNEVAFWIKICPLFALYFEPPFWGVYRIKAI